MTIKLVTKPDNEKNEVQQSILELLHTTNQEALAGEVQSLIIVTKDNAGMWVHRASVNFSIREEIGALEVIKAARVAQTLATYDDE